MIKINLLPHELIEKQAKRRVLVLVGIGVSVFISLLILFLFVRIGIQRTISARLTFMESELKKYQTIVDEVKKLKEMTGVLESKKNIIENLMKERLLYPVFMEEFLKLLPQGLWINSLTTNLDTAGLQLTISCIAFDVFIVADFVSNFEKSEKFRNVELGSISKSSLGTFETVIFQIVCNYVK